MAQRKLIFMQLNIYKLSDSKPSIYASEARKRLLLGGALQLIDFPSSRQINKLLQNENIMTIKKYWLFCVNLP